MIVIETSRIYAIYVRTNRRVKWQYSTYGGRYETPDEAIEKAKSKLGDTPFENRIENMNTDEITTGFVNWGRKV